MRRSAPTRLIHLARQFLNINDSLAALQYRVFVIFFFAVLPGILLSVIEPNFIMAASRIARRQWLPVGDEVLTPTSAKQRTLFVREASSKMYSPVVFALAQLASETPASILCSVVFFLLLYYTVGLNYSSDRAGYAFAMVLITEVSPAWAFPVRRAVLTVVVRLPRRCLL